MENVTSNRSRKGLAIIILIVLVFFVGIFVLDEYKSWEDSRRHLHDVLVESCFKGDVNMVKKLLDENISPNVVSGSAGEPLSAAVYKDPRSDATDEDRMAIIKILLDHGADVNGRPADWLTTPLMDSVQSDFHADSSVPNVVNLLLARGANTNLQAKGKTALMYAVSHHVYNRDEATMWSNVVKILLDAKADVNLSDDDGNTALMYAINDSGNPREFLPLLVNVGADINAANTKGETPLIAETRRFNDGIGDIWVIDFLIQRHANVNVRTSDGETAFKILSSASRVSGDTRIEQALSVLRRAGAKE